MRTFPAALLTYGVVDVPGRDSRTFFQVSVVFMNLGKVLFGGGTTDLTIAMEVQLGGCIWY